MRAAEPTAPRPNIVLVMADDMGFSDIGCYGGEINTPRLDALAKQGLRFTQFYNTSRCCPTRAALLTGLYSHQAGIGLMTEDKGYDSYRGQLNRRCVTIAEALRPAGYRTYMAGKWHVTRSIAPNGDKSNWPRQRGFDRFYGTITGAGSFYDPTTLCRDNTYITPENDPEYRPEQFYYTDAISDNAVKYLKDHARQHAERPFFLYVAYTAAHWPMHALPEDIAKYKGKYDRGYDAVRRARHERIKQLGLVDPAWKLSPTVGNWSKVKNKDWEARCMEVYAAMVDRMDQGIGRIVDQLQKQGALENTLFIYLQDNGGCAEGMGRASNAEQVRTVLYKPFGPDQLQKQIWPPMQTRDGRAVRTGPEAMPGPADTYVAYGQSWANVSNTPFRQYKHFAEEGGISTPLIVHWPRGIAEARRGKLVADPGHLIDLMATFVDVSGAEYPQEVNGRKIQPLEGISLVPALAGDSLTRDAPLCFEHHGNCAIRDGRWKLVRQYRPGGGKWELYDIDADRTELNDLAAKMPEKVDELSAQYDAWAKRVGALPWPVKNAPKPSRPKPADVPKTE